LTPEFSELQRIGRDHKNVIAGCYFNVDIAIHTFLKSIIIVGVSRKHRPRKPRPQTPDLENQDLENPDLENADLENTDLENADFENTDLLKTTNVSKIL